MGRVLVLNIEDSVVGPHLQLLRWVCSPASASRPHITIRYFDRLRIPDDYRMVRFHHLDVIEPDRFPQKRDWPKRAVFLRCELDDAGLLWLEHKPDHPAGDFHITLYDGASEEFGTALLEVLNEYHWGFRIELPGTSLSEVPLGVTNKTRPERPKRYPAALKRVFRAATLRELTASYLEGLTQQERLAHVRQLCESLTAARAAAGLKAVSRDDGVPHHLDVDSDSEDEDPAVHLTPPELAHEIAGYAVSQLPEPAAEVHFGDPAVGTGVFYGALLRVLGQRKLATALGIDISPRQVLAARRRWRLQGMDVELGDYLHLDALPKRSLILANPPYLRHQDISPDYKRDLCERASAAVGIRVSGRAGLYVYFLLLSHNWMLPDAVAAWLLPSGFMNTDYGKAIRDYLTTQVQLVRVHQYDATSPQFERVKIVPTLVVFRNAKPASESTAVLSFGGSLSEPRTVEAVPVLQLKRSGVWTARGLQREPTTDGCRIDDLFVVRRGIATGANEYFVLERERARNLGIPDVALRPLLPKVRTLGSDVVEAEADGYPAVSPQLALLDCDLSEKEIAGSYPALYEYLLAAEASGISDRTLVRSRHPWYSQEKRQPAPFLCTYMGRGPRGKPPLRFIWNRSRAVATNTYLMLYPRPPLAQMLAAQPGAAAQLFQILKDTAQRSMTWQLREYAEGLRKIEPGALRNVRVESCPAWLESVRAARLEFASE